MKVTLTALLRDAWQSWRHDKELLIAIAGAFVFLPALAIALLVPDLPQIAADADPAAPAVLQAYQQALTVWITRYGLWWLAAQLVLAFGQFAMVGLYVSGSRPAVGSALLAALRRLPTLLLAMLVIAVPVTLLSFVFVAVPFLLPGHVILVVIVSARAILLMPIIHAESPVGAFAAVGRSFRMTRGYTFVLSATVLSVILAVLIGTMPFAAIDSWMADAPNPVARAIVDSCQAVVTALGAILMALVQVAAYRRLSST